MSDAYIHDRKRLSTVTRDLAAVAMGRKAADLYIRHNHLGFYRYATTPY